MRGKPRRKGVNNTSMIEDRTFPEGKVGEQYSPRDVHFILTSEHDESHRKGVSNTPMLFACIRAFLS